VPGWWPVCGGLPGCWWSRRWFR